MKNIRVGIVGVGNNAAALVQGAHYYGTPAGKAIAAEGRHGILFPTLCGYGVAELEFSCAFDVDERKIGLDLNEAIHAAPNCYPKVTHDLPKTGAVVQVAPVLDGVPDFLEAMVTVASSARQGDRFEQCVKAVRDSKTEVLLNFLPSGCDKATEFFALVAAAGGAAYVNCTPSPSVHSPKVLSAFVEARLPLLGDDLESHFGSSLLHRTLLTVLEQRGLEIRSSYQVNLGGNTDFKNLSHRPDAKKRSKMKALSTVIASDRVDVLPSGGFVKSLGDNKVAYMVVEGRGWLDMPVTLDLKLKVQDSSNAAGVIIDLVRLAAGARKRGLSGDVPLSYYFKNPLGRKLATAEALAEIREFDRGAGG